MGNLQLMDWKLGHLEIAAQRGFSRQFLERFRIVKRTDDCACGRAFHLRDTVVVEDVANDPAFLSLREAAQQAGFRSVQSTPLISRSGALLGIISTHGSHCPNSKQLEQIKLLARETANELISLRSHAGATVQKPTWPSRVAHRIYKAENAGGNSRAAIAREAIARATRLLNYSKPDTFLGKQHHTFIPLPDE